MNHNVLYWWKYPMTCSDFLWIMWHLLITDLTGRCNVYLWHLLSADLTSKCNVYSGTCWVLIWPVGATFTCGTCWLPIWPVGAMFTCGTCWVPIWPVGVMFTCGTCWPVGAMFKPSDVNEKPYYWFSLSNNCRFFLYRKNNMLIIILHCKLLFTY